MNSIELEFRYSVVQNVVREAGSQALEYYRHSENLNIKTKGLQDRASEADLEVEKTIRRQLMEYFPDDLFLGEESVSKFDGNCEKNRIWVVDPIDGTDCFIWSMPAWCISIAWMENNSVKIGVIYDPVHNELFSALKGKGAFLNGKPLKISNATTLRDGITSIGYSNRVTPGETLSVMKNLMHSGGMFQRNGSGALSMAWVAAGRYIAYYEPHINVWDCLAGILLVTESGGWTNGFLDNNGFKRGNPILASAPGIIDQVKQISGIENT